MTQLSKVEEHNCYDGYEISIICCARNAESYIGECISSVIGQKGPKFKFLLLDDFSSDNTLSVAKNILVDNKISYEIYRSHVNLGVPKSRNALIKICKTPYIAIQDADDLMTPYRLAIQMNFLNQNSHICTVGGRAIKIDDAGNFVGMMSYSPVNHDDILLMLTGRVNPMIDPTVMMRKSVFDQLGGYSENDGLRLVQDFDLWIRMCKYGFRLANIDAPMIIYRVNSSGLTATRKDDMIKAHVYAQACHKTFLDSIRSIHGKTER